MESRGIFLDCEKRQDFAITRTRVAEDKKIPCEPWLTGENFEQPGIDKLLFKPTVKFLYDFIREI